jgi:hypothetical protein
VLSEAVFYRCVCETGPSRSNVQPHLIVGLRLLRAFLGSHRPKAGDRRSIWMIEFLKLIRGAKQLEKLS